MAVHLLQDCSCLCNQSGKRWCTCTARAGPCTQTCCASGPWSASGPSRLAAHCRGKNKLQLSELSAYTVQQLCRTQAFMGHLHSAALFDMPQEFWRDEKRAVSGRLAWFSIPCCQGRRHCHGQCLRGPSAAANIEVLSSRQVAGTLQASGDVDPAMVRDLARLMPDPAGSDDLLAPGALCHSNVVRVNPPVCVRESQVARACQSRNYRYIPGTRRMTPCVGAVAPLHGHRPRRLLTSAAARQ